MSGSGQDLPRPWTLLSERPAYKGWMSVGVRRYRLPDGRECDWEVLTRGDVVQVLPLTPQGRIVAVRMFRCGPNRVITQLPGGFVDPGERPDQAAARELLEETGYECQSVEVVGALWASSVAHPKHVAIARGCRPTGEQSLDEYEECVPVELTVAEFRTLLRESADVVSLDAAYMALDHAGLL